MRQITLFSMLVACTLYSSASFADASKVAGSWRCIARDLPVAAFNQLPAGKLTQKTAYSITSSGLWASNSIVTYQSELTSESYRINTTGRGRVYVNGNRLVEEIQAFQLVQPYDYGSPFKRKFGPSFNTIIIEAVKKSRIREYALNFTSASSFTMTSIQNGRAAGNATCQKVS